ncbi:MAG: cobalamin biosynthesis protein CbiA [Deltaproteobacteria bacterium]|nr:cobalamin biosynthesis protein CbiA [Deltaproteobacteria bacterium]MBW2192708.1 cobalamin biosynthesis protein CbiA [Deltaproteobacteria bacterium]
MKNIEGIIVIVGNFGSGKTEVAINLAVNRKLAGIDVRLADLDLVNPYFRTREARKALAELGIEVVVPPEKYLQADLPILSPVVSGMIRQPSQLTLLDAGGDNVGATVLGSLTDSLRGKDVHMFQVVNPFRPFTETVSGCLKIREEIEGAAKMTINGIIGNANLIDETTVDDLYRGYDFIQELSRHSGLPVKFITAVADLFPLIDRNRISCDILKIERQLVPPWKKAARMGAK